MLSRLASSALTLSVLAILAASGLTACDPQPAPKDQGNPGMVDPSTQPTAAAGSAVPTTPTPTPTPVPTPTQPAAGSGSAAAPTAPTVNAAGSAAPIQVTEACSATTAKIAQVMIDAATDPTQKAALEQDRTKLIRRMAEACTRDAWPAATLTCFQAATTTEALQTCSKGLSAP